MATKKILTFLALLTITVVQLSAQETTFSKGDKALNLGIGFGSTWYSGTFYHSTVPPVSASLEFGVAENVIEKGSIGVGPYLGYSAYKWEYSGWGYKYSNVLIGIRGNFHYPLVDKLDTYAGLLLGYNVVNAKEYGNMGVYDYTASGSSLRSAGFIGARYYFTEAFAVMAELGYGVTYLNLGIALKF